jgi:hypothetical protein
MTDQEALNRVWQHFVVEGQPLAFERAVSYAQCLYFREADGARCAVGILVPEELARRMPLTSIMGLFRGFVADSEIIAAEVAAALNGTTLSFIEELQMAHDEAASVAMYGGDGHAVLRRELEQLATREALVISPAPPEEEVPLTVTLVLPTVVEEVCA